MAPTWGGSSLIEQPLGRELLEILVGAGYQTTLRLHPMTVRRLPDLIGSIRRSMQLQPLFTLEQDMSAVDSWIRSDLMISDWSGAATEYAFALGKPVLYVDTPPKIMNAEWHRLGIGSFEDAIRREIGRVVDPLRIETVPDVIEELACDSASAQAHALEARGRHVFNIGASASEGARYLTSR
jgi:YidC/Oxa1 family membrane protein insertase